MEFALCCCTWLAEALPSRIAGRNIHALDPYRMPSAAALQRGAAIAEAILDSHRTANAGAWPETVSVRLCSAVWRNGVCSAGCLSMDKALVLSLRSGW